MNDDLDKTIKVQRHSKVGTDSRGRTVWTKPVEPVELELVSTMMLEQLLEDGDEQHRERIRELAEGEDGVLARDTKNEEFAIVRDDELEAALQAANRGDPGTTQPELTAERAEESDDIEELSLVTTQVLRTMLAGESEADAADDLDAPDDPGGYNPYDHG